MRTTLKTRVAIAGVFGALAMGGQQAWAQECTALLAPPALSLRETGFDRARAACGANDFSAGTRVLAALDAPNFYGTLSAGLYLDYHLLHESGFEFGIGARLLDYRFVQSVLFTDAEAAVGPVHLEVALPSARSWWGQPVVLTQALHIDIPVTNTSDQSFTLAASPSLLVSMLLSPSLHLHARVAALLWGILPDTGADSRRALATSFDVGYAPVSALSLLAGAEVQAGWYGLGLDHVEARAGFRVAAGEGGAVEVTGASPLFGEETVEIGAVFWIGYRRVAAAKKKEKRSRLQDWAQ